MLKEILTNREETIWKLSHSGEKLSRAYEIQFPPTAPFNLWRQRNRGCMTCTENMKMKRFLESFLHKCPKKVMHKVNDFVLKCELSTFIQWKKSKVFIQPMVHLIFRRWFVDYPTHKQYEKTSVLQSFSTCVHHGYGSEARVVTLKEHVWAFVSTSDLYLGILFLEP